MWGTEGGALCVSLCGNPVSSSIWLTCTTALWVSTIALQVGVMEEGKAANMVTRQLPGPEQRKQGWCSSQYDLQCTHALPRLIELVHKPHYAYKVSGRIYEEVEGRRAKLETSLKWCWSWRMTDCLRFIFNPSFGRQERWWGYFGESNVL